MVEQFWLSIEMAPKDGTQILVSGGIYGCDHVGWEISSAQFNEVAIAAYLDDGWYKDGDINTWFKPTHWMHLPLTLQAQGVNSDAQ